MADTKVIIEYHTQADIKMSQNVYYYEGMNYQDVENEFKSMGFTNIELETDSSIFSSNEHGEVSGVKIDGNSFEEGDRFPPSVKVVITYCEIEGLAEAERGETITIENNSELAYILSTKDEFDSKIQEFANKYAGEMIEFDAHTVDVSRNEDYKTRFNYLIHAGDYSTTSVSGPNFQFHDVSYGDLNDVFIFLLYNLVLRRVMDYYMAHVLQFLHLTTNVPNLVLIGIMILNVGIAVMAVMFPAWKMIKENIISEIRR